MSEIELNILIIDDNPAIHTDFIKVLSSSSVNNELDELDRQIFGDDEALIKELALKKHTYSLPKFIFDSASQGREGVELIKLAIAQGKRYTLAFVDVRMPPGWDGIETIRRMWEVDSEIQVVICTAYSDYSWEDTVEQLGMGDNYLILKKPFDTVAVRQLACALTRKWILAQDSKNYTQTLKQTIDEKTKSLQNSLSLLRSTIESSADGILVVDLNKKLIDFNTKFLTMWDISNAMVIDKNSITLFKHMLRQLYRSGKYLKQIYHLDNNIGQTSRHTMHFKDGKILECSSQPHYMNDVIIGRVWGFRDVTERAKLEQKLEYQASHDMLTGLPNRILLNDRIQQNIEFAVRNNRKFALLFFDLDRFKLVNDSLSHEIGDSLLCMVANRLSTLVRKQDTFARLGGDEFVMIIPELKKDDDVAIICKKILQAFKQPFELANREIIISTSIGISLYPRDGKTVNTLLKNADLAMYQAKENGGNQFHFYTRHLNKQTSVRFKQESELHHAIERNEFVLHYQPQLSIDKRNLLSVEALIRWQHPVKGLLLPIDFIRVAEESGLIIQIGEWVIREACRQINVWKNNGLPMIRVAVNVATQQLKQNNFADTIKSILTEYQIDPQFLELEITENVVITHSEIIHMINLIKKLGVKIVLDDFGTGKSSLNYLKQIHIDRLKIDKSFVQNISTSHTDEVIIEAIIAMARSFNFKVLAEGVENQDQMNFLKKLQCDEVQGYLFSKPLPALAIEDFMKGRLTLDKD